MSLNLEPYQSALISSPRSYNDTPFNRLKVSLQIAIWKRFRNRRHANSSILFLSSKRLLKYGRTVRLAEVSALRLVAQFTSIPVPKVYCAFRDDKTGVSYIVMERINGEPIIEGWKMRSETEKRNLLNQLKEMFEELRAIPDSRAGRVCAADGGKLHDYRIYNGAGEKGMGPFENEGDFNLFLRNGLQNVVNIKETSDEVELQSLIDWHRAREERHPSTFFTHGDANPTNILVKGDRLVGLIDFEMSGFYPEYWEWTTAMNFHYIKGWREEIHHFLTPWPEEQRMDDLWRKFYCDSP